MRRRRSHCCQNDRMADWSRSRVLPNGIELLEASFDRHVYERHVHDTFAIGVTLSGVQRFWCRGATNDSVAGNVMVIRPGEVHDGRSGTPGSYSYRMIYVPVELIRGTEPRSPRTIITDALLGERVNRAWRALADGETTSCSTMQSPSSRELRRNTNR